MREGGKSGFNPTKKRGGGGGILALVKEGGGHKTS